MDPNDKAKIKSFLREMCEDQGCFKFTGASLADFKERKPLHLNFTYEFLASLVSERLLDEEIVYAESDEKPCPWGDHLIVAVGMRKKSADHYHVSALTFPEGSLISSPAYKLVLCFDSETDTGSVIHDEEFSEKESRLLNEDDD